MAARDDSRLRGADERRCRRNLFAVAMAAQGTGSRSGSCGVQPIPFGVWEITHGHDGCFRFDSNRTIDRVMGRRDRRGHGGSRAVAVSAGVGRGPRPLVDLALERPGCVGHDLQGRDRHLYCLRGHAFVGRWRLSGRAVAGDLGRRPQRRNLFPRHRPWLARLGLCHDPGRDRTRRGHHSYRCGSRRRAGSCRGDNSGHVAGTADRHLRRYVAAHRAAASGRRCASFKPAWGGCC